MVNFPKLAFTGGFGFRFGDMTMLGENKVEVRPAVKGDMASIHGLIAELADFENLQHQFVATVEDLENGLTGQSCRAEALVAVIKSEIVGYAIFFPSYSTFIGKEGLWLEDLYVQPGFRGKGIGKALILAVNELADERGCQRLEWSVLDWNDRAIKFYESLGAEVMSEWKITRLDRDGIEGLSK